MSDPIPNVPPEAPGALFRYKFGTAEFNESTGELQVDGQPVAMEPRPLAVLRLLLQHAGEVVTREELIQQVWDGRPTVDNVLPNAMTKLRRALGDAEATVLVNLPRVGYKLAARVERQAVSLRGDVPLPGLEGLKPGAAVPHADGSTLVAALNTRGDVWRARDAALGEDRVFKFAVDGARLSALRREMTLYRVLRGALGERDDFVRVMGAQFDKAPYHLACAWGGEDLLAWAAAGHLAALGLPQRLALFLGIARTVADAHNVGVLHRDLKPANVLIQAAEGGGWHTRLTDFGSGRLLEPERLAALKITALGGVTEAIGTDSRSGTLRYLAPELREGQAPTQQSDLWSLGLMLFQLCVGDFRRQLDPGWEQAIDDDLLREDLRDATHGDPSQRLGSVGALIDRLSRLDARRRERAEAAAAQAERERLAERLRRSRARRPLLAALGGVLVLGLAGTLWQWRQAVQQREAAQQAARQAEAVLGFLREDVLRTADPLVGAAAVPLTVREAVRAAADRVAPRFEGLPAARGQVHAELARILHRYGELAAANAQWAQAAQALAAAAGPADPQRLAVDLERSVSLGLAGEVAQAQALLDAARPRVDALPSPHRLRALWAHAQGALRLNEARLVDAIPLLESALREARALNPAEPALLDRAYGELTGAYENASRTDEAARLAREWLTVLDQRPGVAPGMQLMARMRLAQALVYGQKFAEARPLLDEVIPRMTAAVGPTAVWAVQLRHVDCEWLGLQDRNLEALDCQQRLLDDLRPATTLPPRFKPMLAGNLGIAAGLLERWAQADAALALALADLKVLQGTRPIRALFLFPALQAKLGLGDLRGAVALRADPDFDPALASGVDPSRPWELRLKSLDGQIAHRQGQMARARALLDEAVAGYEALSRDSGRPIDQERLYLQARALRNALRGSPGAAP